MNTIATVDKKMLVDRLTTLGRIVYKGPTLPVLANIYVEIEDNFVTLRSTNLEIYERATMPAQTEGESCAVTIPAYMLLKLVKKAPKSADTITLSIDMQDVALDVECGAMALHLRGIDAEEFPAMPDIEHESKVWIDSTDLLDALQQTLPAVSKDVSRMILNGVSFSTYNDILGLEAADGFRLAVRKVHVGCDGKPLVKTIIPAHTLEEVVRELKRTKSTQSVDILVGPTYVQFQTKTVTITSHIIEGHFPDIGQVVPKECAAHLTFQAEDLLEATGVIEPISNESAHIVRLHAEDSMLTLAAKSAEMGTAAQSIPAELEGVEAFDIAVNVRYLKAAVQSVHSETVRMGGNSIRMPVVFRPNEGDDYLHVVMPMNLD